MTEGTILQNLRDFTVQIRRPNSETIVGTGIAVSLDGRIVTCAHVVEAAISLHPRDANGTEIGVYFPQHVATKPNSVMPTSIAFCGVMMNI